VRAGNVARDNRARAPDLLPAHGELRRKPQRRQLVEFTLTPEGDERTRLRVVESGHELLAWPDAGHPSMKTAADGLIAENVPA